MLSDKDFLMQAERYKDIRREVGRDALVRQALAGRPKRAPLVLRGIVAVWHYLSGAWNWVNPPQQELGRRPARRRA